MDVVRSATLILCLLPAVCGCESLGATIAHAAVAPAAPRAEAPTTRRLPPLVLRARLPEHAGPERDRGFLGQPEQALLEWLRRGPVARVEKGGGGRSLGFKLELKDGTRGYFKPEQSFSGTNWYAELATMHLDRALGLHRVPPSVSRTLPWKRLSPLAAGDRRRAEVAVGDDGKVRGVFTHWLAEPLGRAKTPPGFENWLRVKPFERWEISPLQRSASFGAAHRMRSERLERGQSAGRHYNKVPEPTDPALPADLSDMLLLDYLTVNVDRWGGNNGNVRTYGRGGPLIFFDNAAGFSPGPAVRSMMERRLALCQRFRKSTVEALKALDMQAFEKRIRRDPNGPLLDQAMLEGLEVRRQRALSHVAALVEAHGAEAVLPW
ncbi:MAG: hypothetical protein OEZ06_20385 [Myxococcales bacterium]|nr:hypothetical protein [Myxococcales bacterium]